MNSWKLNTSNIGKFEEFKQLFMKYGSVLEATHIDLREIDADPIKVVAHKASQLGEGILVEDTSLDIEGASVGIHIRWVLDHINEYEGRRAEWTVLLAVHNGNQIDIYKGSVTGKIVLPKGEGGFGFDPVFMPEGSSQTLAESKPDIYNARVKAVEALLKGEVWAHHPVIEKWEGPWQKSDH